MAPSTGTDATLHRQHDPRRPDHYPFAAIIGQEDLKLCLILCAVDPSIGGVLIRGDKGTAKSTAARGIARLMPRIEVGYDSLRGVLDPYNRRPTGSYGDGDGTSRCSAESHSATPTHDHEDMAISYNESRFIDAPFVELPIGATEDRVLRNEKLMSRSASWPMQVAV